jgi:3-hydroxyisobutyrate dehydrogenase-like beta-hydroxyacid dehydrogenase
VECNNPVPSVNENASSSKVYEPGGTVNIIKKDHGLAINGAEASGAVLREKAHDVYQPVGETDGGKDISIVYQWLQNQSPK